MTAGDKIEIGWDCQAMDINSFRTVFLKAGHKVTLLHDGADQDGFDNEIIVETANGQKLAINKNNL